MLTIPSGRFNIRNNEAILLIFSEIDVGIGRDVHENYGDPWLRISNIKQPDGFFFSLANADGEKTASYPENPKSGGDCFDIYRV